MTSGGGGDVEPDPLLGPPVVPGPRHHHDSVLGEGGGRVGEPEPANSRARRGRSPRPAPPTTSGRCSARRSTRSRRRSTISPSSWSSHGSPCSYAAVWASTARCWAPWVTTSCSPCPVSWPATSSAVLRPGQVPGLGAADQGQAAPGLRQGEVGGERRAGVHQRGVDLVGDHQHAVLVGQPGHRGQLLRGVHRAGRVLRVAQQVRRPHPGVGERGLQGAEVEPVVSAQRRLDQPAAGGCDEAEERVVDRRAHHHRSTRGDPRLDDLLDPDHHVGHLHHPGRDRPPSPTGGRRSRRTPPPAARSTRSRCRRAAAPR